MPTRGLDNEKLVVMYSVLENSFWVIDKIEN